MQSQLGETFADDFRFRFLFFVHFSGQSRVCVCARVFVCMRVLNIMKAETEVLTFSTHTRVHTQTHMAGYPGIHYYTRHAKNVAAPSSASKTRDRWGMVGVLCWQTTTHTHTHALAHMHMQSSEL